MTPKQAYLQEVDEVIARLQTNRERGLAHDEVEKRLRSFGYNELPPGKRDSWGLIFLRQFQNPLIYILLVAAVIIFIVLLLSVWWLFNKTNPKNKLPKDKTTNSPEEKQ